MDSQKGMERIQAMIALQLLVAFVFIFMGITKLADKFVNGVPNSIKGGILIAAPITVLQGQLSDGSQLMTAPIATLSGTLLLAFLSFSPFCEKNREKIQNIGYHGKIWKFIPISDCHVSRSIAWRIVKTGSRTWNTHPNS